jgi:hypothetical protein
MNIVELGRFTERDMLMFERHRTLYRCADVQPVF